MQDVLGLERVIGPVRVHPFGQRDAETRRTSLRRDRPRRRRGCPAAALRADPTLVTDQRPGRLAGRLLGSAWARARPRRRQRGGITGMQETLPMTA